MKKQSVVFRTNKTSMKNLAHCAFVLLIMGVSQYSMGQEKSVGLPFKFPNPETGSQKPVMVKPVMAHEEAQANLPVCGFTEAYFEKTDIIFLMNVNGCVGIRFYISMEDPKQRFTDLIAVAIREDGKEIAKFLKRKYRLVKALDAHFPDEVRWMSRSTAKKCVDNLIFGASGLKVYTAYISQQTINGLFGMEGCTGVKISPAMINGKDRTMSFVPAKKVGTDIVEIPGTDYLQTLLPCPVDCGDMDYYLWER